jgi:translation initiation factor 4E
MPEEQPTQTTTPESSEPVPDTGLEPQEQVDGTQEQTAKDAAPLIADDKDAPKATAATTTTTVAVPPHQPLNAKWTLWFDNPRLAPAGSDWKENLKQCGSFESVELFWRVFNNLKPASQLSMNSNYSVFRYGVEPSWEDPANVNGGKFVLTIPKKDSKNGKCDEWWLYTVLAVVGETMDVSGDEVNGAVVSIRKNQDRIALWLKGSERDVCVQIAERWKKALNLEKQSVRYQTHKDAAASGRSFRNEIVFEV